MFDASQQPGAFRWTGGEGRNLARRQFRHRGDDYLTHESVLATAG